MKPERILIARHGQSQGNVDREIYKDIPDYALQLTDLGRQQAAKIGHDISQIIQGESIQFYVSPFWRTRQTYLGIVKENLASKISYYEDPRLREQEWSQKLGSRGGYRDNEEVERDNYGHFYFRFNNGGESCADVFDRVSDFMGTMFRDFKKPTFPRNAIIVTHGMTMRLFIMRWFHVSVEEFETWANPKNCEVLLLERRDNEKYELSTPLRKHKVHHSFQFPFGEDQNISHILIKCRMNLNEDIVPTNLEEAVQILKDAFDDKELGVVKTLTPTKLHISVGQYIRNQWSLWQTENVLTRWFYKEYGVVHADDVSGIILECLVADLNDRPRQDRHLAKEFIEHWEKYKTKTNKKDKS